MRDRNSIDGGHVWNRSPRAVMCGLTLVTWSLIYGIRAFDAHFALRTSAYDLSVFDYALWSTGRLGLGYVPFMGHSLFSHHFMPTLLLLWPAYQLFPSPVFLIALQLGFFVAAAVLLYRLLPCHLPVLPTVAILAAFLFGRRSHSAAVSMFYVESLAPLLVFGLLLALRSARHVLAIAIAVLALGCKEDMSLYLATFGATLLLTDSKRLGAAIALISVAWLLVAVVVAVPASRVHDGLPPESPFVEASAGSPEAIQRSAGRLSIGRVVEVLAMVTASTGFLCWLAPTWLAVAVPGLLLTLVAANPHGTAIGITGHYLFPILPWMFAAAAIGAERLQRSRPTILRVVSALLLLATIGDSPLWQAVGYITANERAVAASVRNSLRHIPPDAPVLAMPNLVPHLPHRDSIWTIDKTPPPRPVTHVVISPVGNLWPLDAESVDAEVKRYAADPSFAAVMTGPLYVFQRVSQ